jgi:ABC-type branched-subunit amino acid transport system substrate-binding protein
VLFIKSVPSVAGNFVVQVRQAGLDASVKLIASVQVSSPVFRDIAGRAAEGIVYASDYDPDTPSEENKYFAEAYRRRNHSDPDHNAAWAYTGLLLLVHAIRDGGPGVDRAKVRDALANLKNIDTPLGAGSFSFDQNRMPDFQLIMLQVVNRKEELVKYLAGH